MKQLRRKALTLGFSRVGVTPARPGRRLDAYLRWIAQERHGAMGYMARPDRVIRRQDLDVILPGVQSIICVGLDYYTARLPDEIGGDPSRGRISNYAWGLDYHDIMTPRLQALAEWLVAAADGRTQCRVYVDTGAILERDHAETAGLGFTGKNSMLIQPRGGSYFFLGEILTTLPIANDQLPITHYQLPITNAQLPSCGACRRCLDVCPTDAFPEPYVLDARRCISYLTIELKGWIPQALRPLMGNWVFGCDICQEVCPFNRFAAPTEEPAFYPSARVSPGAPPVHRSPFTIHHSQLNVVAPPLLSLLALDDAAFNERFAHSPIKRIKRPRLVRNACVAAGNWGSEAAVPALVRLLADPEPLVRGHAAWALRQIGTPEAKAAVARALETESDTAVRREMADDFLPAH
ncbi:MAG: tRNA epoxyqueuosine(34) reductase QueG [Anaerolineae bacterium]